MDALNVAIHQFSALLLVLLFLQFHYIIRNGFLKGSLRGSTWSICFSIHQRVLDLSYATSHTYNCILQPWGWSFSSNSKVLYSSYTIANSNINIFFYLLKNYIFFIHVWLHLRLWNVRVTNFSYHLHYHNVNKSLILIRVKTNKHTHYVTLSLNLHQKTKSYSFTSKS